MEKAGDMPDIIIAPFGGGSNFAGLAFPFLRKNFEEGVSKTILFNLSGHGNLDMSAYDAYFNGNLVEHELTTGEIESSLSELTTPTNE